MTTLEDQVIAPPLWLGVARIQPSKTNPDGRVKGAAFDELVASVRIHGVLQPILVREIGRDEFRVVAGTRRLAAAKAAGIANIPVVVRQLSDEEELEIQLVENLQRRDLHPLEEAQGYAGLLALGYKTGKIAARIGRSISYVYDRVKLLELTDEAQQCFLEGSITAGHAILLARLSHKDQTRALDMDGGGVYEREHTLFDPDDKGGHQERYKARSVDELQAWIDEHVRFDPKEPDPMLFPEAAAELDGAEKVIAITKSHFLQQEARDPKARTFGPMSWKRADGREGSKSCEHAVTGFIAAGHGRGEAFKVCVARDRCEVHWAAELKAKKKRAAKASASPAPKRAAARDEAAEEARDKELRARWIKGRKAVFESLAKVVSRASAAPTGPLAKLLDIRNHWNVPKASQFLSPGRDAESFVRYAAFQELLNEAWNEWRGHAELPRLAKPLGFNVAAVLDLAAPIPPTKQTAEAQAPAHGKGDRKPAPASGSRRTRKSTKRSR